ASYSSPVALFSWQDKLMWPEAGSPIFVVIAAYNEAVTIARVIGDVSRFGYEIVVVDDGSRDGTADIAKRSGAAVLRHRINLGQGAALQTGIDYALRKGAERIVTFDADGQHRAQDIPKLLEALDRSRVDYALGSRFLGSAI